MARREVRTRDDLEKLFERLAARLRMLEFRGERGTVRWRQTRAVLARVQQSLLNHVEGRA